MKTSGDGWGRPGIPPISLKVQIYVCIENLKFKGLIILDCLTAFTGSMMTLQDTPEDVLGEKIFKMKIFQLFDLLKLEKVL